MAEFIPRDLGTPFDPADPVQLAEFEGFACEVPSTDGMITAVAIPPLVPNANSVRAARMFRPGFLDGDETDLPTPDPLPPSPNATFERQGLHDQEVTVPLVGGGTVAVTMWSFESRVNRGVDIDSENRGGWPAQTIRVREGELAHTNLGSRTGPHTIHQHGIEPTSVNDGVGHLTFEVAGGRYVYQWLAGEAGTYFYHCHRNTTLHFEMGMYGMLIVDPDGPYIDGGPGKIYVANDLVNYDAEAIWVADDIDTRWHGVDDGPLFNGNPVLSHVASGIQDCDTDGRSGFMPINDDDNPHLHDFNPNVFVVSGQAAPFDPTNSPANRLIPGAGATLELGQKLMVRALNASYCNQIWKFPTSLQGSVTAIDGRTLGRSDIGFGAYSHPFSLASINRQFLLTTARRYDVLIDSFSRTGQHLVEIEFRHWITNALLRTVEVPISVQVN